MDLKKQLEELANEQEKEKPSTFQETLDLLRKEYIMRGPQTLATIIEIINKTNIKAGEGILIARSLINNPNNQEEFLTIISVLIDFLILMKNNSDKIIQLLLQELMKDKDISPEKFISIINEGALKMD